MNAMPSYSGSSLERRVERLFVRGATGAMEAVGKPLPEPRPNRAQRRLAAKMQRRKQAKGA